MCCFTEVDEIMNANSFAINGRRIGPHSPCYLIAEVAQAHDGSLGLAHSYVDAVAAAGADAIKFQTHIAAAESTPGEPFRVKFSFQDATRYDYWRRMEFTLEQWQGLADHCADVGITFLSSPFSLEAVEMLKMIGMPMWKVGSGEVSNPLMLSAMAETGRPILLSTGMSSWDEITQAVEKIRGHEVPLGIFQCTSKYPTPLSEVGLNVIDEIYARFGVPTGLSDHSGKVFPGLAAMARGIDLLEVHVVFDRGMFGPDSPASLTLEELKLLSEARDAFHTMSSQDIDKDVMASELAPLRKLFNKSVALREDQPAGTVLQQDMLTVKKPGTGIPAKSLDECVGRKLAVSVPEDRVLNWEDLENT